MAILRRENISDNILNNSTLKMIAVRTIVSSRGVCSHSALYIFRFGPSKLVLVKKFALKSTAPKVMKPYWIKKK